MGMVGFYSNTLFDSYQKKHVNLCVKDLRVSFANYWFIECLNTTVYHL